MKISSGSAKASLEEDTCLLEDERFLLLELDFPLVELDEIPLAELDDTSLVVLEETPLVELEDIEVSSLELDVFSGSSLLALEELSPQAARKSKEQIGSNLKIVITKIYLVYT